MDLSRWARQEQDDDEREKRMETTKTILNTLRDTMVEQYEKQLSQFGPARTPKAKAERVALVNGFKDGINAGIHHTCKMLGVEVKE